MNEWWKQKAWPAIKKFFKKYGGYIVAFVLGAAAYFGLDTKRIRQSDKNLQRLADELNEYRKLNEQLAARAKELEQRLGNLARDSSTALDENRKLREEVADARRSVAELESSIRGAATASGSIGDITERLSEQSQRAREALERLRRFIESHPEAAGSV